MLTNGPASLKEVLIILLLFTLKTVPRPTNCFVLKPPSKSQEQQKMKIMDASSHKIPLTEIENTLFTLMRKTADELNSELSSGHLDKKSVEVRVVGGWVRDRLLNVENDDLDCMVTNISASVFAQRFRKVALDYVTSVDDGEQQANKKSKLVSRVAVIEANPEKGKHVPCATVCVLSHSLDFAEARTSVNTIMVNHKDDDGNVNYLSKRSSVVEMDAYLRDFTVNSLFYNIHLNQIEDFCEGVDDLLHKKRIRCPLLGAQKSLGDDPLRAIRALRFAVRLNLSIDAEIDTVIADESFRDRLKLISRERYGKELESMIEGKSAKAVDALQMIFDRKLEDIVFLQPSEFYKLPTAMNKKVVNNINNTSPSLIRFVPKVEKYLIEKLSNYNVTKGTQIDPMTSYLSAVSIPIRFNAYKDHKDKELSVVSFILREGLKYSNNVVNDVTAVLENIDLFDEILSDDHHMNNEDFREKTGLLFYNLKSLWSTALLIVTVMRMQEANGGPDSILLEISGEFIDRLFALGLQECWTTRPLLNGNVVKDKIGVNGKEVGYFMEQQKIWQLRNPSKTAEDCLQHLMNIKNTR